VFTWSCRYLGGDVRKIPTTNNTKSDNFHHKIMFLIKAWNAIPIGEPAGDANDYERDCVGFPVLNFKLQSKVVQIRVTESCLGGKHRMKMPRDSRDTMQNQ
jgi:hypothetical protein